MMSVPVKFRTWFDVASYSISVNMCDIGMARSGVKGAGDVIADEVPLVAGYNQIQISITSKSGEKFPRPLVLIEKHRFLVMLLSFRACTKKYAVAGSGPQYWAVVVGVSEYKSPGIPSLKC